MDSTNKLKLLIAQNKTKEAISKLISLTKNTNLYDEVVQQSAKYAQYEKESRQGTETKQDLDISLSRINTALLSIIDQLSESPKQDSKTSISTNTNEVRKSSLWKYITAAAVIIGIFGSLAEILNFINIIPNKNSGTAKTVTVLVHGKEGKDDIVLPNRGIVYLIYGDAKIPEQINNEGEATFKQIPESFFAPSTKVELLFEDPKGEPYRVANRDTLYDLKDNTYIALAVILEGMEQISSIVEDFETGDPLDSVMIRIFGEQTHSNEHGEFTLEIPEKQQSQFITLRAFKEGYRRWEMKDIPTTNKQEITIPLKKQ